MKVRVVGKTTVSLARFRSMYCAHCTKSYGVHSYLIHRRYLRSLMAAS